MALIKFFGELDKKIIYDINVDHKINDNNTRVSNEIKIKVIGMVTIILVYMFVLLIHGKF